MSASEQHPELREVAGGILERFGLVLDDLVVRPRNGTTEVRLVVDLPEHRTGSADLDTVAEASSAISEQIDANDSLIGPGPSVLEVTTPGVDRPLTTARHFRRARGRLVLLRTVDGAEHRARVLGVDDDEMLRLRQEPGSDERGRPRRIPKGTPEQLSIPLTEVDSARVQIEFDPPADLEQLLADDTPADADGPEPDAAPKES